MKVTLTFTSGQICKMFRITKQRLLFYHKIGILTPSYIDEKNRYRYYTSDQFPLIYLIISLSEVGLSLNEIKEYMNGRSPDKAIKLLERHTLEIKDKIEVLQTIYANLDQQLNKLKASKDIKAKPAFFIKQMEEQYLLSIPVNGQNYPEDYDTNISYAIDYVLNKSYRVDLGIGFIVEYISSNKFIERSYYAVMDRLPDDKFARIKPKGQYVCTYHYGGYDSIELTFKKLFHYIEANNLSVHPMIYCMEIIDILTTEDESHYVTEIMVQLNDD